MSLTGRAVVSIWHNIADEGLETFYAWHTHEHMPERTAVPGFVRGRRYIAAWGNPLFFNLYEADSIESLAGPGYQDRLNKPSPWTLRTVPYFTDLSRALQRVHVSMGPGVSGHMLTIRLEANDPGAFCEAITKTVLPPLAETHGVIGIHLCQTDPALSGLMTKEKEARDGGTTIPGLTIMLEATTPAFTEQLHRKHLNDDLLRKCGAVGEPLVGLYRLEYIRNMTDGMPQ